MSAVEIHVQVNAKLDQVRAILAREITGQPDVCLTCSFQAEDVLLAKLAIELDPSIPILFLDTGYHFQETYAYRDRIAREWRLNLINLLPEKTVAEQEALVPEYSPLQLQVQEPGLVIAEAVPAEQRLAVGGAENDFPLAVPQAPFTAVAVPVVKVASTP